MTEKQTRRITLWYLNAHNMRIEMCFLYARTSLGVRRIAKSLIANGYKPESFWIE